MKFFREKEVEPVFGFEDFWKEIEKLEILPEGAIKQLPESLDDRCRAELMKRAPEEAAEVIMKAIEQVNHGSIESVEDLVLEILKR